MNYQQTIDFLFSQLPMFQRTGAAAYKADLSNTIHLCKRLGNPEKQFPAIHIAGTNGKGSVSHMLASVLQEAGYKTGLFTSPHLKDFRERIRVNGRMAPESFVVEFVKKQKELLSDLQPSFFEYSFAMAMEYFAKEEVDIAVIETGMGGRLDSTNVVRPILSVITNISKDHTRYLGDTIDKIAVEKAGIIKPQTTVVIGETEEESANVFREFAEKNNAPIFFADQQYRFKLLEQREYLKFNIFDLFSGEELPLYNELSLPLTGNYQRKNVVTAIAAMEVIKEDLNISKEHVTSGFRKVIENTGMQGRWQILQRKPLVICDTGHNENGIRHVTEQLKALTYHHLHIVLEMVDDKDISAMLSLFPLDASYYFCKPAIPRGLDPVLLQKAGKAYKLKGKIYGTVKLALENAVSQATTDDVVFIGGSTFVVAEVL